MLWIQRLALDSEMKKAPVQVGDYSFTILIEPNDPDGYLVTCPALPGLVTQGDTLDEAYAMAKDAIEGYLMSLIKHGNPITAITV